MALVQDKTDSDTGEQNIASMRVLSSCGFEERGRVQYDDTAKTKDRLFVLDWDRLRERIESRLGDSQE